MNKIDHIGIAVNSISATIENYRKLMDFTYSDTEHVASQKTNVCFLEFENSKLELLEPTAEESPIAIFIKKRGEGLHHFAYMTNDIYERIEQYKKQGYRLINEEPIQGANGKLVCFIHPKETHGVLIEICQKIHV